MSREYSGGGIETNSPDKSSSKSHINKSRSIRFSAKSNQELIQLFQIPYSDIKKSGTQYKN